VIYLRMFSDTVKSMDTFHDRLVARWQSVLAPVDTLKVETKGPGG